jgi:urease accessory protein
MTLIRPRRAFVSLALVLVGSPALAHTGSVAGGFLGGFAHPVLGPDHVVAMVAVGLWGAFLGAPAIWLLPVVFPLVMAFGGVVGILGVPIPAVETGIATSAVVLGLMVALAARPPLWVAAALVGVFAIFHGVAHGHELASEEGAALTLAGMVGATVLLHLAGIAFGWALRHANAWLPRLAGAAVVGLGATLLAQAI